LQKGEPSRSRNVQLRSGVNWNRSETKSSIESRKAPERRQPRYPTHVRIADRIWRWATQSCKRSFTAKAVSSKLRIGVKQVQETLEIMENQKIVERTGENRYRLARHENDKPTLRNLAPALPSAEVMALRKFVAPLVGVRPEAVEKHLERFRRFCDLGSSVSKIYYHIFMKGPATIDELVGLTSKSERTVYYAVRKLQNAGLIMRDRYGRWLAVG